MCVIINRSTYYAEKNYHKYPNHPIIRILELENIDAYHIRAEDLGQWRRKSKHGFHVVICRALTDLARFISLALPLVSKEGMMIALKGRPASLNSVSEQSRSAVLARRHHPEMRHQGGERVVGDLRTGR